MQAILDRELEGMSSQCIASALSFAAYKLGGQRKPAVQLNNHSDQTADMANPPQSELSSSSEFNGGDDAGSRKQSPSGAGGAAVVVQRLCEALERGRVRGTLRVSAWDIVTAVVCAGRVIPGAALPPTTRAALVSLLRCVQPRLFVCSCQELARLAQGMGYLNIHMDDPWTYAFMKVSRAPHRHQYPRNGGASQSSIAAVWSMIATGGCM
jgi:hypothetical protein